MSTPFAAMRDSCGGTPIANVLFLVILFASRRNLHAVSRN